MEITLQRDVLLHLFGHLQKCTIMLLAALFLPAMLFAQADTAKKLNEVTVRSSTLRNINTLTPSQTVISADFIKNNSFNVAEAIRNFAGVNVRDYGGIGGLKTVSVRSLGANHTGVFYDGIQINDAQNGAVDLGRFNINNVEEISLYSAQVPDILTTARAYASASVLNIKTLRPRLEASKPFLMKAGIKGGSFGLVQPYLQWQQRISHTWSYVLNGYYQHADGRYKFKVNGDGSDTLRTRKNSDVKTYQVDGGVYWAGADSSKFTLQFNYYNSKRGLPGAFVFYTEYPGLRQHSEDIFVQASYEHAFNHRLSLLLNSKASQSHQRFIDTSVANGRGGIDEVYKQRELYQSAALRYRVLPQWAVSYSADIAFTDINSNVYDYSFPNRLTLLNALATDVQAGKWHFQGNILFTHVSQTVETGKAPNSRSVFSPTVAASFKPWNGQNLQFRAFYKNIFRNPNFSEEYYYTIQPRNIKPEYADQYNLGFTYSKSFNGVLTGITFSTDAYYNYVKDKIVYLPTRSAEISTVINLGKVDIKGADVNLKSRFSFSPRLKGSLTAAYTYQLAQDVTDPDNLSYLTQIVYTPKHAVAVNAGLEYERAGVFFNTATTSSRYNFGSNDPQYLVPAYSVSDASAYYNFKAGRYPLLLSAEVNNVFNRRYDVISNFPMPPRSLRLTMQITI